MARIGKIPVMAAAAVAKPDDATFVFLFIDSGTGKLSTKDTVGTVVIVGV